jgi:hypothetical protein
MNESRRPNRYDVEEALDDFYGQLAEVTPFDSHTMIAAWGAIDPAERTAAWRLVREETGAAGRGDLLDEARESVLRWSRESGSALEGSPYSLTHGDDLSRAEARARALPPVLDAAAALIVRDRLPIGIFDVLYAPWAAAADVDEDEDEDGDGRHDDPASD